MTEERAKKPRLSRTRTLILGLGVIAALIILLWQANDKVPVLARMKQEIVRIATIQKQGTAVVAIAPLQMQQKVEVPAVKSLPDKDEVTILNDKGVALVLEKQYWPGVFLFKQAMDLDQSRIEPVMNMAVTLDELGLSRPAARYLVMVEEMRPDYPPLQLIRQHRKERMQGVDLKKSPESPHDQKP